MSWWLGIVQPPIQACLVVFYLCVLQASIAPEHKQTFSPAPALCLWCHLPDVLAIFIYWPCASYSWICSVLLKIPDDILETCSLGSAVPHLRPWMLFAAENLFLSILSEPPGGTGQGENHFFSTSSSSLTWMCDLGWLLICPCEFWAAKRKEEGSAGWDTQPGVESSWDGYAGFTITSWIAEVCRGQREAFLWALNLHQYLRSFLYLLQMGCNSFLSSFLGLFIFYFKPNNLCTSCQAVYCITFLLSSDTISSLTHIGRFPPALLCLVLLQTLISALKAKAERTPYPLSAMLITHCIS